MNEFARSRHDLLFQQRMRALNNSILKLHNKASVSLTLARTLTLNAVIMDPFILELTRINEYVSITGNRIIADFHLIKQCNHHWINIQPMVCKTDAQRYTDFMNLTYFSSVRDMITLCELIETSIKEMDIRLNRLNRLSKKRTRSLYAAGIRALSSAVSKYCQQH